MFNILDGRNFFYQWDTDRKLIVNDASITEVHFCNRTDECSLVCEVYDADGLRLVDVPNVLLQQDWKIRVYAFCGYTKIEETFKVYKRTKPADYVYTETEVKSWDELESRMAQLENQAFSALPEVAEGDNSKVLSINSNLEAQWDYPKYCAIENTPRYTIGSVGGLASSLLTIDIANPLIGVPIIDTTNRWLYIRIRNGDTILLSQRSIGRPDRIVILRADEELVKVSFENITGENMILNYTCATGEVNFVLDDRLTPSNVFEFTPTGDYNPVHKKYVDEAIAAIEIPDVSGFATTEEVQRIDQYYYANYYNKGEVYNKSEVNALIPDVSAYQTEEQVLALIQANMPASGDEVSY